MVGGGVLPPMVGLASDRAMEAVVGVLAGVMGVLCKLNAAGRLFLLMPPLPGDGIMGLLLALLGVVGKGSSGVESLVPSVAALIAPRTGVESGAVAKLS